MEDISFIGTMRISGDTSHFIQIHKTQLSWYFSLFDRDRTFSDCIFSTYSKYVYIVNFLRQFNIAQFEVKGFLSNGFRVQTLRLAP